MTDNRQRFEQYLSELKLENIPRLMDNFDAYLRLLTGANRMVNLVSRNLPPEKYWVQHFLDSLMALKCLDIRDKVVLDFGTGGGIPGIPLKLAVPEGTMVLLDSVQKKMRMVEDFVTALHLADTSVVCSRLEDYAFTARRPSFDYIVCRAVALEARFLAPLRRLLKPTGMVILYKAQKLNDLDNMKYSLLYETHDPELGQRRIIGIRQLDLMVH